MISLTGHIHYTRSIERESFALDGNIGGLVQFISRYTIECVKYMNVCFTCYQACSYQMVFTVNMRYSVSILLSDIHHSRY